MERIETIIVGAGQAGLATSYHLMQAGREHLALEQASQPASVWRNERWDSFTLVTPNWVLRMPGAEYSGPDPDGFLTRDAIAAYFEAYVERFQLPIQTNTRVLSIEPMEPQGYRIRTTRGDYEADNIVMATGFFQTQKTPPYAARLSPHITQLFSGAYRNPDALPPGAVLVVGSGQSGAQIAEELSFHGRKVFLSTGTAGRVPRRYRGRDALWWLTQTGFFDMTPEQFPPGTSKFAAVPHVSGANGGHTLNLHQFARDGMTLLGHVDNADGDKLFLRPDLYDNLEKADQFERELVKRLDGFIQATGIDAPEEALPQLRDGYEQPFITELDLKAAAVSTIIWATGYSFDYSLVKLPVRDADGFPIQSNGISSYPGLYFVGIPWMPSQRSGFLLGVGDATRQIAEHIAARARRANPASHAS